MTRDEITARLMRAGIVTVLVMPSWPPKLSGALYAAGAYVRDEQGRPVALSSREMYVHASSMVAEDVEACEAYLKEGWGRGAPP